MIKNMSTDRNRQLVKDVVIYGIGNIGSKFLTMLLFPLLSFYIAREEIGYYDISLEAILFLLPLTTLQMRESTFRLLIDTTDESYRKSILSTTLFIETVIFAVILVLAAILPFFFTIRYFPLIILSIYAYSFYEIYIQAVRSVYSSTQFVVANIICSFFSVSFVLVLYFVFKRDIIEALFAGNILSRITAMLIIELPRRKVVGVFSIRYVKKQSLKEIFSYSIPMLWTAVSFAVITSSGKFIVNYFGGNENSGVLALSQKYMVILLILGLSFYQAWQVTAVKNYNEKGSEKFFSEVFNKYAVVLCLLVLVISFGLRSFKAYLLGSDFYQSADLIYLYCASALFFCLSIFFEVTYQCTKQTSKILYSIISCAIITLPLTIILTKYFGMLGNLTALTIAYSYLFVFRYFQTKSTLPIQLKKEFFLSSAGLVTGGVIFYGAHNRLVDYLIFFIAALLLCYFLFISRNMYARITKDSRLSGDDVGGGDSP